MITLPEGYAIHKRDKTRMLGGSWNIRVVRYDKNMVMHDAFVMAKETVFMADNFGTKIKYAARLLPRGEWVMFDTEEDMCIAMCAKHRMLVR